MRIRDWYTFNMENENLTPEQDNTVQNTPSSLHIITPLSKYLAMVLFIILPFLGGYIGYTYAPEKIVEVEKIVVIGKEAQISPEPVKIHYTNESSALSTISDENELWIVSTSFGTKFVSEPNDHFLSSSYNGVERISVPDFEYIKVIDSRQSIIDEDVFFLVTEKLELLVYEELESAFVTLNTDSKEKMVLPIPLPSETTHPPGIANLNTDESLVRLGYSSCTECDGNIVDFAVFDTVTGKTVFIGNVGRFEWLGNRSFRYMPPRGREYIIDATLCGLGGCAAEAYDWTGVEWTEGSI
jgi:hypothetical protein